ncbi:MAG: serine--tRNA ligase [Candidatus Lambdaproteobacteria bacterium]|nr:serine--tRNA ligase [Candidatus Lambdaproteobacteria bacterium]
MLEMRTIRDQKELIAQNIRNRALQLDLDALLAADERARAAKTELDAIRQRRNEIGKAMQAPLSPQQRAPLVEEGRQLKEREAAAEQVHAASEAQRLALQVQVPNLTHPDAPIGKDDAENKELRVVGERPHFDFPPKDHVELMEALQLVDFEGGAKVAGQKFYYLKNQAVLLEIALMQFACRVLQEHGFTLYTTPDVARQDILSGIGFNPRGESTQIYNIENSDLSLVATAEITLGGLLAGDILDAEQLPMLCGGISHCFRTEAGSAGRESRGLYRVHQFTKIEMFAFTRPEESEAMHQRFVDIEEEIYQRLEVPYRVVDICTGDLGAPAYRKFDLEAWMPGRQRWGEITSTSNCTDYQSRRLNIRFKERGKKGTRLVHMLNGTAIAVSRAIIALVENGQQADGSIRLPKVLGLEDIHPR